MLVSDGEKNAVHMERECCKRLVAMERGYCCHEKGSEDLLKMVAMDTESCKYWLPWRQNAVDMETKCCCHGDRMLQRLVAMETECCCHGERMFGGGHQKLDTSYSTSTRIIPYHTHTSTLLIPYP